MTPVARPLGIFSHSKGFTVLILSRKKNESIVINDDITIVVVEIRGDKARLGISAPKDTPVHRLEVYEAIKRKGEPLLGPQPGELDDAWHTGDGA